MKKQHAVIPHERWLPVVGYEGYYEVSDHGRVKRMARGPATWPGRILKGSIKREYPSVALYRDAERREYSVHRLVMAAFVGPCPEGNEVNHKDGIKANSYVGNLEYVTRSENVIHAVSIGTKRGMRGEKHPLAKLTEDDVRDIRKLLQIKTVAQARIAEQFGVSYQTISYIASGKTWGWLK